ncbi:MAG: IS200/IS605 family transposase [Candidatus Edwardsbacteria bacterium]
MANTYTQIYIHTVFAVQDRTSVIQQTWKERLYKYITGIIQNEGHKLIAINGRPDHIHIFIGMKPLQSIAALVQKIKANSSKWINENRLCVGRFSWQEGYGAFSCSHSQIDSVVKYIMNQEVHHKKVTFTEEYRRFLKLFDIEYDARYIFEDVSSLRD